MNRSKTLVVGLGNPILGDDGVGWRVAEAVQTAVPHAKVEFLALGGLSLMERLIGYDRVIIIDSIQTKNGRTGDIHIFPLQALPDLSAGHTTAVHDTSLQTALALGRQMGAQLPDDITIVGIEATRVYDFSDELTPEVETAVPQAVTAVLALLQQEAAYASK
ncbi:MAG: hydrogenase maturation protease [Ardenticatenaceae bacterium]|nr:hydrogenase maturation protease [Ardenticatenaceae bacterium]